MGIIVSQPADNEDRQGMYRFLYKIWAQEGDRILPGTDHDSEEIKDDLDDWATHFMALDEGGQIAGCVRVNRLSSGRPGPELRHNLGLDLLTDLFRPETVVFISHLAVSPAHRGGTVISLLLAELFRHLFETRINVAVCYCRLGLVNLYHRIGMRPFLPNFKRNERLQVPLIGCINDRSYLERSGSPLHALLPKACDDRGWAAGLLTQSFSLFKAPRVSKITNRNLWAQLAHAGPERESEPGKKLFEGINSAVLENLLTKMPRIGLAHNESVQITRPGEAAMGILINGALGLGVGEVSDPHFIYVISPGEPFGELETLTQVESSTVIMALEESEILLLPDYLFERMGKQDPETAINLYKNLLAILARRTAAVNLALSAHLCPKTQAATKVHRPARHLARSIQSACSREESYHFDTLADPDGELARLTCQAQMAEALELGHLKKIGLTDGDQILDLGSGPGITSTILARHFPGSHVFGVEPEANLRIKAEAMARAHHMARCHFLEGTGQAIPLEDNAVDFSYARLLFQHIPDPLACLKEMKRVTRPGGIVCVLDVDDGTIFIHPKSLEWEAVETRVAHAQANFGGDRHVGRKLLGYYHDAGFEAVQMDIVPVTTQMLGPKLFFDIVFGFKQQHLKRFNDWDDLTKITFARIRESLMKPGAFASENIFVAHGVVG